MTTTKKTDATGKTGQARVDEIDVEIKELAAKLKVLQAEKVELPVKLAEAVAALAFDEADRLHERARSGWREMTDVEIAIQTLQVERGELVVPLLRQHQKDYGATVLAPLRAAVDEAQRALTEAQREGDRIEWRYRDAKQYARAAADKLAERLSAARSNVVGGAWETELPRRHGTFTG